MKKNSIACWSFCSAPKRRESPSTSATLVSEFRLAGPSGEPVSFARTLRSHGCADLAPAVIDGEHRWYRTAIRVADRIRTIEMRERNGLLRIESPSKLSAREASEIEAAVRRMFRLDEDFHAFYAAVKDDARLGWVVAGAGRMMASPTVFEDVVKTICTTNCAWSGTIRMVGALVRELGGGAFPTPLQMSKAPEAFYRDVARAGYRGAYLRELARMVARRELDLEALRPNGGATDAEVEEVLLALPGVGPYACAHVMMLLGRYRRLVLDSWTRPTYLAIAGKKRSSDRSIERAFNTYGAFAGLAFWLYVTRGWLP
ncbi:MAG TPA: hypothetical protein VIG32_01695 [Candidatus Baltobacteraceae bacterium]